MMMHTFIEILLRMVSQKYFNDHRSSRILVPGLSYAISKINFLDDKFNTPGSNIFFVSSVLCFFSLISLFLSWKTIF